MLCTKCRLQQAVVGGSAGHAKAWPLYFCHEQDGDNNSNKFTFTNYTEMFTCVGRVTIYLITIQLVSLTRAVGGVKVILSRRYQLKSHNMHCV